MAKKKHVNGVINSGSVMIPSKPAAPTNMEELLTSSGYVLNVPQKGQTVKGLVTAVTRKAVMVDIGAKTEGLVTDKEYAIAKEFIESIKVGDEIEVFVSSEENDRGQILLSLRKAMFEKLWDMLDDYLKNEVEVLVKAVELNKGGMIVKWQGLRGFVPSSQFGAKYAGNLRALVGTAFKVKPIEVDRTQNRLIFSEKHVSEAELLHKREEALKAVKVGETYEGTVSGIMSFGAFVSVAVPLGDASITVEGLVHISEISWEKVEDIRKHLSQGDKVKVKVLGVEEGTGKLNLSIKQLLSDPWTIVAEKYAPGTSFKGTVSRLAPFGIFVNFEPGVDGLIHISKAPNMNEMKPGDKVDVTVESVDVQHRRMSLGFMLTEVPVGYK